MKYFLFLSIAFCFYSCAPTSSETVKEGQKEIFSMFGTHKMEKGDSSIKITFAEPDFMSDSTNRPAIVGACALMLYKNMNAEERAKYTSYDFNFEGYGKSFKYGFKKSNLEELITYQNQATEYANMLCMSNYEGLRDNIDSSTTTITEDSLKKTFGEVLTETAPMDSIRYYAAHPAEFKRKDSTSVKIYRFAAFIYQGKKTFYYRVSLSRPGGKITSLRCVPKKEQREYSLPLQ